MTQVRCTAPCSRDPTRRRITQPWHTTRRRRVPTGPSCKKGPGHAKPSTSPQLCKSPIPAKLSKGLIEPHTCLFSAAYRRLNSTVSRISSSNSNPANQCLSFLVCLPFVYNSCVVYMRTQSSRMFLIIACALDVHSVYLLHYHMKDRDERFISEEGAISPHRKRYAVQIRKPLILNGRRSRDGMTESSDSYSV